MDLELEVNQALGNSSICILLSRSGVQRAMELNIHSLEMESLEFIPFYTLVGERSININGQNDLLIYGGSYGFHREDLSWMDTLSNLKQSKVLLLMRCRRDKVSAFTKAVGQRFGENALILDVENLTNQNLKERLESPSYNGIGSKVREACLENSFYIDQVLNMVDTGICIESALTTLIKSHAAFYSDALADLPKSAVSILEALVEVGEAPIYSSSFYGPRGILPYTLQRGLPPLLNRGWVRKVDKSNYTISDPVIRYLIEKRKAKCLV